MGDKILKSEERRVKTDGVLPTRQGSAVPPLVPVPAYLYLYLASTLPLHVEHLFLRASSSFAPVLFSNYQVLLIAGSSLYLGEDTKSWVNIVGFIVVALASTRYSMLSVAERNREIKGDPSVETGTGPLLPK